VVQEPLSPLDGPILAEASKAKPGRPIFVEEPVVGEPVVTASGEVTVTVAITARPVGQNEDLMALATQGAA
jgi:hypothetical protein